MDLGHLKNVIRDAALLNIGYYASIVDLSRNYLDSLRQVIEAGGETAARSRSGGMSSAAVPPLLLAARAGERAEGAFAIVNNLQQPIAATIEVSGDVDTAKLRLIPQGATLAPGEQTIVRVSVDIDGTMEAGRDRHATIAIPGLGTRSIPLVLRRLPDPVPAAASGNAAAGEPKRAPRRAARATQRSVKRESS